MTRRRVQSRVALAGLLALFVTAQVLPVTSSPMALASDVSRRGDAAMFAAVVDRLQAGESYYTAMGSELRAGDYPTASLFNWRTPALYVGLGAMPRWLPVPLMGALAVLVLGALMVYLAKHGSPEGTVIGLLLAAAAAVTVVDSQGRWLTEAWCGLFIGLSLAAYLWSAWVPAALLGLAALFLRELAAPYCMVCALLAFRAGRTRELTVWGAGLAAFGLYYAWHVVQVFGEMRPGDLAHPRPWLRFGGLGFWLATIKTNKAFFATPRLVLAAASVLLVAALWARSLPTHVRWSVVAYGLFFAAAGQPFNDYWGFVSAFVYALALAYGPVGLSALIRQATAPLPEARGA